MLSFVCFRTIQKNKKNQSKRAGLISKTRDSPEVNQQRTSLNGDKTGLQFSLAVNGSTTTTDKAKVDSNSRWTTSDAYGYQSSLDHEKSESTSDVHFVAELGTENMLLDFGISGGDSAEIEQEFTAWTQPTSDPIRTLPSLPLNSYSETSESHSSAGLVLGGDDPGLTSSGGYSVDIEGTHEIHGEWIVGVMIITGFHETYHDHGGDVESTQTPQHRLTQQIFGVNGQETTVVFDKAPEPTSPTPPRSLDDILNEYRDRQTQLARLQAELAETTDPDMQKFLQDQINVETNILADITTTALAAGATQADLDQITSEAQAAAADDPIVLQSLDNFNDIYIDAAAPGYFYFLTNPSAMDDDLETGFYVAGSVAAIAGGAALALDIAAVYGLSQLGVVGLGELGSQVVLEYQLIMATSPGALGLVQQIERATGLTPKAAGEYFGWAPRIVTRSPDSFTRADLLSHGFSRPVLQNMAWIYQRVTVLTPSNPSAAGRAQQLQEIIDRLFQ